MHPWYRQQIVHLLVLCKETFNASPTGELLNANAVQLRLEMGMPGSFTDAPIHLVSEYMTTTWLKDLLQFLHKYRIGITDLLPQLTQRREGDLFLMEFFISQGFRGHELELLNAARQVIEATTLSDICSVDGKSISKWAWEGKPNPGKTPEVGWPRIKPRLTRGNWAQWQQVLPPLLQSTRSLNLRQSLGAWLTPPPIEWKWFFSPSPNRLFSKHGHVWRVYRCRPRRRGMRHTGGIFANIPGFCPDIPLDLEMSEVVVSLTQVVLKGTAPWLRVPSPSAPATL